MSLCHSLFLLSLTPSILFTVAKDHIDFKDKSGRVGPHIHLPNITCAFAIMSTRYYLSETQSFETDLTIQKYKSDHIMSASSSVNASLIE